MRGHRVEVEQRSGHLQGVRAIVTRLLSTVRYCALYLGENDFQQALVIRHLARDRRRVRGGIPHDAGAGRPRHVIAQPPPRYPRARAVSQLYRALLTA